MLGAPSVRDGDAGGIAAHHCVAGGEVGLVHAVEDDRGANGSSRGGGGTIGVVGEELERGVVTDADVPCALEVGEDGDASHVEVEDVVGDDSGNNCREVVRHGTSGGVVGE